MAGRGIGEALISIGRDVGTFSNAEQNRRTQYDLAKMRDDRERELADLKTTVQLMVAEQRAAGRRGGGTGGGPMSEELMGAAGGLTVPEFTEARRYAQTGETPMTTAPNMTADAETGRPIVDLAASSRPVVDEQRLARIRANVERMRTGLLAGNVDPKDFDQLQKGLTEAQTRTAAFAPDANLPDVGRRVAAKKGEGEFVVQGNTKVNKFTGETETTEVGESVITRNELTGEAAKVRAAIQRALAAGGGADTVQRTIETGDGRVMVIYRSGRREILMDDSGRPIPSSTYAKQIGKIISEVERSPWFLGRGKEQQKEAEVDRRANRQFGEPPQNQPPSRQPSSPGGRIRYDAQGNRIGG